MSKTALIAIIVLIFLLIGLGIYLFLVGGPARNIDAALLQTAVEMNKTLPMMVDTETRLDATTAGPGARFTYTYTLVNHLAGDVDVSVLQNGMRPSLVAGYKTLPQMKDFRDGNVELHYQYKDKHGIFLTEIVVSPKDF